MTSDNKAETYGGLAATGFKTRLVETIRCRSTTKRARTTPSELSKHVWQLKSNQQHFTIKGKILVKAKHYSNQTKRCNLCKTETHFIMTKPDLVQYNISQTKRTSFYFKKKKASIHAYFLPFLGLTNFRIIRTILKVHLTPKIFFR